MGLIHTLRRWYSMHHGRGRAMLDHGAELLACPHCGTETPVYRSDYGRDGRPVSFSVCLWCEGLIEYDDLTGEPHEPYLSATEVRVN